MVEAMISLAKELELEVIAEGVETQEQTYILRELNRYIIQGYYYAKPLPENELIPLLKEGTVRAS
jgi:Amt family ammonium transporter